MSQTHNTQKRTFPGRYESLAAIGEFITQVAEAAGFDARDAYAVQMAVDEACSNIIEHAYGEEGIGDIECTSRINEESLTIVLRDHGHPFNPDGVSEPALNVDLEERDDRGLGLFFIRKLMDEAHFEFTTDVGNVLTLVKHRK